MTLGERIDEIYDLKQQKKDAEDAVVAIERRIAAKEDELLAELDAQGTVKATGRKASVSVQETIVPQVEDWDAFYAYVRKNNAFELLQRRPVAEAWREHAMNRRSKTVPGTVPFAKRKVSIRVSG